MQRGRRIPDSVLTESLFGLRLVCLHSNGVHDDDGSPKMQIDAKKTTIRMLAHDGRADHLIRERPRNWLIMVVGVGLDDKGEVDSKAHFVLGRGKTIAEEELRAEVQGKLDRIKGEFNAKHLIDWGWIGEILPNRGAKDNLDDEGYVSRAEEKLLDLLEERRLDYELSRILRSAPAE